MHILENIIESYLIKKTKDLGAICWKFVSPGNAGVPDRIVIYKGRTYYIELKRPSGKLRPLQEKRRKDLFKNGYAVYVLHTKEEVDIFVTLISGAHSKDLLR